MFWLLMLVIALGFLAVCFTIARVGGAIQFELALMHHAVQDIRDQQQLAAGEDDEGL